MKKLDVFEMHDDLKLSRHEVLGRALEAARSREDYEPCQVRAVAIVGQFACYRGPVEKREGWPNVEPDFMVYKIQTYGHEVEMCEFHGCHHRSTVNWLNSKGLRFRFCDKCVDMIKMVAYDWVQVNRDTLQAVKEPAGG